MNPGGDKYSPNTLRNHYDIFEINLRILRHETYKLIHVLNRACQTRTVPASARGLAVTASIPGVKMRIGHNQLIDNVL